MDWAIADTNRLPVWIDRRRNIKCILSKQLRLNYTANKSDDSGYAGLVLSCRIREPDLRADATAKLGPGSLGKVRHRC